MLRVLLDVAVLTAAYVVAFQLRFDWAVPPAMTERMLVTLPLVVTAKLGLLFASGLHRRSWRYTSLRDAIRLYAALATAALGLLVVRFVAVTESFGADVDVAAVPAGVVLIDFVLSFLGLAGLRAARRLQREQAELRSRRTGEERTPTLLIGAGEAGAMVARELASRPDLGLEPVGFLDDDPDKQGSVIRGVPVLATIDELAAVADETGAERALITIANAAGADVRRINDLCVEAGLETKIIPGVYEIVGGRVSLTRIRDVEIDDLLRREAVELDLESIEGYLAGRTVLVTGAGGSIGSGLARQIAAFSPDRLVLLDKSEGALFHIDAELRETVPSTATVAVLADVCNAARIGRVLEEYGPSIVFHAAAHKHVPLMEANPREAVANNVFGTTTLAETADAKGVEAFVCISTDKAVNPRSVMGATKRATELFVQALDRESRTRFLTVRFGNVLDSNGSVIPTFRRQIERGGPVTVTHPGMSRFFMTIPEACQLVLQAATMGAGGEVFILDMGEAIPIVDLAHDLISLAGYETGTDIDIVYTGARPGEKLHEELAFAGERARPTDHPKILVGRPVQSISLSELNAQLRSLRVACDDPDPARLRAVLRRIVTTYEPALTPPPLPPPERAPEVDGSPIASPSASARPAPTWVAAPVER